MDAVASDAILARLLILHPKIIDLTLDRVHRLLACVGHPERRLPPVIHVAGTNGKGSVVAMLRAGIEGAGRTAHAYTSPHLARFHERIRIAGELIPEPALAALLEECEAANGAEPITFFEITTVAALLAFARAPADYTLLEVGLGGRLDATNVVDRPALTAITPVSHDHQQYLGETLPEIAGEKAGILKPGVPCVVGRQEAEALAVIRRRAAELGAPLAVFGEDWTVARTGAGVSFEDADGRLELPPPALPGAHQVENAGIAVALLRRLGLGAEAVAAALARAEWPARMQRLSSGPLVGRLPEGAELWLDGGHNPSAGEAVAALLAEMAGRAPAPVHLIAGMLDTKDVRGYFAPLAPHVAGAVTVPISGTEAAIPPERLAEMVRALGIPARPAEGVGPALGAVLSGPSASPPRILICGSLYLAGEVLRTHG
jgi:dihydrofolate synthase/folylpolyglutamate synthase